MIQFFLEAVWVD